MVVSELRGGRKGRLGGAEADVGLVAAGDQKLFAPGGALGIPAEKGSEFMGADARFARGSGRRGEVELRGLEPLTFRMPSGRSAQLSYSPAQLVVARPV